MVTHRWKALSSALFLCAFSMAPASARLHHPRSSGRTIRVTATRETLVQWQGRMGRDLNDHMVYPRMPGRDTYPEGAVRIAFRCSDDGKPADTRIVQSSGLTVLDHAALRAVNGIETLHPLPVGVTHDQPMEAWVIYAQDDTNAADMKRRLSRSAQIAALSSNRAQQTAALETVVLASR